MVRAACLVLLGVVNASAYAHEPQQAKPAPADVKSFEVSAAAEPSPIFKYSFFPNAALRRPGNAVPIYLRFAHERSAEAKELQHNRSSELLSAAKLDLAASRDLINRFTRLFRQIDHAARRQHADWSYTIDEDREEVFGMLLSDAQECRVYHRMVCLKARVEIEEGKYELATRTIETAYAMADQLAQGPFLVNNLIGIAAAGQATDRVEELLARPGAPSLYWALAALPRPVTSTRKGLDLEFALGEIAFPELYTLDKAAGAPEFGVRLARVVDRFKQLEDVGEKLNSETARVSLLGVQAKVGDARAFLLGRKLATSEQVEKMPAAQLLLLAIKGQMEEIRDQRFRALVLPAPEARIVEKKAISATKPPEILPFSASMLPFLYTTSQATTRLERRVAALRLIEALRLHAHQSGNKLPTKLADLKVVTIPQDPSTGLPFGYSLQGETAVIASPRTGDQVPDLKYSVTIRK